MASLTGAASPLPSVFPSDQEEFSTVLLFLPAVMESKVMYIRSKGTPNKSLSMLGWVRPTGSHGNEGMKMALRDGAEQNSNPARILSR